MAASLRRAAAGGYHTCCKRPVDLLGSAGEEIFGRGVMLLLAATFFGWRGAALVSGVVFLALHLGNPGAGPVWLFRLLQGVLLAYAVFRTGSLGWSVGYQSLESDGRLSGAD